MVSRRPYNPEYEDPDNPDVPNNWIVWIFLYLPGSIITWYQYMFPKPGQVLASRRRAHNRGIIVAYSVGFWSSALAIVIEIGFALSHLPNHPNVSQIQPTTRAENTQTAGPWPQTTLKSEDVSTASSRSPSPPQSEYSAINQPAPLENTTSCMQRGNAEKPRTLIDYKYELEDLEKKKQFALNSAFKHIRDEIPSLQLRIDDLKAKIEKLQ